MFFALGESPNPPPVPLRIYGISDPARFDQRVPTVAIRMDGYSPLQLAQHLAEQGIFTWDGNYFAMNLTERLGVEKHGGLLRIGLVHYNTAEEVDVLLRALQKLRDYKSIAADSADER